MCLHRAPTISSSSPLPDSHCVPRGGPFRPHTSPTSRSCPPGPGANCIIIGLPGKLILRDYFQENGTSRRRPLLLLRISFPGRPIFIQFIPGERSLGRKTPRASESSFPCLWWHATNRTFPLSAEQKMFFTLALVTFFLSFLL